MILDTSSQSSVTTALSPYLTEAALRPSRNDLQIIMITLANLDEYLLALLVPEVPCCSRAPTRFDLGGG